MRCTRPVHDIIPYMNRLGVSKIELLVIGLIVGLLGVMAVVAVSTARSRTRDAIRLSDIRQVQTGLELAFNNSNQYPESADAMPLGEGNARCLSSDGFTSNCGTSDQVYLEIVPATPTDGLTGLSVCQTAKNAYCYKGGTSGYRIEFEMENDNPVLGLQKGVNCASESGIDAGACIAL